MKKMLDELKKLDEEYVVPSDFRQNVMSKIRVIEKQNKKQIKQKHLTKYVIPWIASAAVILIACLVTINGGSSDKMVNSSVSNTSTMLTDSVSENSISMGAVQGALNLGGVFNSSNEKRDDTSLKSREEAVSYDGVLAEDEKSDFASSFAPSQAVSAVKSKDDLIGILRENNVEILETSEKYIKLRTELKKVKDIFSDFVNVSIVDEGDGVIRIEF